MHHVILNVHGIGAPRRPLEPGEAPYWISAEQFRSAVELAGEAEAGAGVRVAFTFDDGNASDLDIGVPLLGGRKAEFFVLAGRIGTAGSLDAPAIAALAGMGHGIGSHGWDHVDWRAAGPAGLERELVAARERIAEASGRPVEAAGIPFGRYDRRVLGALRAAGYARVYSSDGGGADPAAWFRPRTSLTGAMGPQEIRAILAGREPLLRRLRRGVAMAVKRRF